MNAREFWEKAWSGPSGASTTRYSMLHTDPSELILDVGCGDWRFAGYMLSDSKMVIGCDVSHNALMGAKNNSEWYRKKTGFVQCDAKYLPFRDNVFDRVVSVETMTLVGKDCRKVVEEMKRVTKRYLTFNVNHKETPPPKNGDLDKVTFSEEELKKLLEDMGLKIEAFDTYTREQYFNWNVALYQQEVVPDGDKKCTILVTAKKA